MGLEQLKKVLITQGQLKYFAGSEIVTLELAEYLLGIGVKVTILTDFIEEPIKEEFDKLKNLRVILTNDPDSETINASDFDLIWVHHQLLAPTILEQLGSSKNRPFVVYHHMSSWAPVEFPIMYDAEKALADIVLFNSPETKAILNNRGAVFDSEAVLGNPAPDYFYITAKQLKSTQTDGVPKRIAVISNHPPQEVNEAAEILQKQGVEIVFIGRQRGGTPERITPDLLRSFDVIITIGKTVQYSLLSNVSVYCYDWFGGSGYLTLENYESNREHNFSGRGFSKKPASVISKELLRDYPKAVQWHDKLHNKYSQDFLLSSVLHDALQHLRPKTKKIELSRIQTEAYLNYLKICTDLRSLKKIQTQLNQKITQRDEKLDNLKQQEVVLKERISLLEKEVEDIKNTTLYKVRRKIALVKNKFHYK